MCRGAVTSNSQQLKELIGRGPAIPNCYLHDVRRAAAVLETAATETAATTETTTTETTRRRMFTSETATTTS